jgi:hypothetical protein
MMELKNICNGGEMIVPIKLKKLIAVQSGVGNIVE